MNHDAFRYDDPYMRPRRRINYFAWTIAILLLMGFALAAWLGSYYIFGQPERPDSYRILKKLDKVEPPKRFELTAAPQGEFLTAKQVYDRYSALRPAELAKKNGELARNYIRNFQRVHGLVPYVVGRFSIVEARELGGQDIFTSGMVALTAATEHGQVLMEHIYPAHAEDAPLMKQTLVVGLEIKLERTHDISAIIHVERLTDGRIMLTAIPLLYGSYAVTKGTGTFSLEPPMDLNLAAGWPLYKDSPRRKAEIRFANYRQNTAGPGGGVPILGISPSGAPAVAENELVPVQPALAIEGEKTPAPKVASAATPKIDNVSVAQRSPAKGTKLAKGATASPAPSPTATVIAQRSPVSSPAAVAASSPQAAGPSPTAVAAASAQATKSPITVAMASPKAVKAEPVSPAETEAVSPSTPTAPQTTPDTVAALPVQPGETSDNALASTAGGGSWRTFEPGKMPLGRLISTGDLREIADRGLAGERVYLKGQFVVNFSDTHRAVLRPRTGLAESMLRLGGGKSTRIVVEFPEGHVPPRQGTSVNRDEARPYEITELRKQEDGQLNVFVREIIQP